MSVALGIVGCGAFAQCFVGLFRDHPLVGRVALCDINSDKLAAAAKRFRISETYPTLEATCRSDLDALVIMTQPWLHAPQAIQALSCGKHVYSAVPVISLDDGDEMLEWCDRLIETCRRTGKHYMMGETSYYRSEAMFARQQAAQGAFGHFVHAEGRYYHDVDMPGCSLRDVWQWRYGPQWNLTLSGSAPMHYPTHSTGGIISATGAHMTEVMAYGHITPGDDWHRADTVSGNRFGNETALFRMSNGATAEVSEYRKIGHVGFEGFSLYGTAGSMVAVPQDDAGIYWTTPTEIKRINTNALRDPLPADVLAAFTRAEPASPLGGHGGSHAYLVHEFVSAVAENRTPAINAWEAARYVVPGVMAHKSAMKDGERLKVPDWGDAPGASGAKGDDL